MQAGYQPPGAAVKTDGCRHGPIQSEGGQAHGSVTVFQGAEVDANVV